MEARLIEPKIAGGPEPAAPAPLQSIGKLMAGLFFTAAGLLLTADNLDLLDAEPYLELWPGLLIVIGVFKLLDPRANRIAGIALVIGGAWLLALNLNWIRFTIFDLWPLVLIALGLGMLARAFGFPAVRDADSAARANSNMAFFASRKTVEKSQDFRGANILAVLGGQELDFTGASINGTATLDVFAFWGGIELVVPDDWEVVSEVTPVMAGFEASSGASPDPNKRLIIRGAAIMAGIEVKNAARRKS